MDRKGERMRGWNTDTEKGREKDGKREREMEKKRERMQERVWNTDSTKQLGVLHPVNQYSYFRVKYREKGSEKEKERERWTEREKE